MCEACRVLELPKKEIKKQMKEWAAVLPITQEVAPAVALSCLDTGDANWASIAAELGESEEDLQRGAATAAILMMGLLSMGLTVTVRCLYGLVHERITGKALIKIYETMRGDASSVADSVALIAMEHVTLDQIYGERDPIAFIKRNIAEVQAMIGGPEGFRAILERMPTGQREH